MQKGSGKDNPKGFLAGDRPFFHPGFPDVITSQFPSRPCVAFRAGGGAPGVGR